MPFKPQSQCLVCKRIKGGDNKLLDRINHSRAFIPAAESLVAISKDIGISYVSLYNHTQKHQSPNKTQLAKRIRATETKQALKDITSTGEARAVTIYNGHVEARKDLLQKGMDALDKGDLKMTMQAVVALLGQEQKAEENAKDRSLEMMKMFNYFASGAASGTGSTTTREHVDADVT